MRRFLIMIAIAGLAGCQPGIAAGPETVSIPAGPLVAGSDMAEREAAYRLDEAAYGHDATRQQGWYDQEAIRGAANTGAFLIMTHPVTNADYARFVAATGHAAPDVAPAVWAAYGLIHPYVRTRRHAWPDGKPPEGRADHPVVLVSHRDAEAYADWLGGVTGESWRLPSAAEWEKAARGADGRRFPWGDMFDPARLNSHDAGPFDTAPVGAHRSGASPFGMQDAAGQVYEWTATPAGPGRFIVKGGSWDDKGCGVCRPAAGHSRPGDLHHIIIGFRLVRDAG